MSWRDFRASIMEALWDEISRISREISGIGHVNAMGHEELSDALREFALEFQQICEPVPDISIDVSEYL